VYLCNVRRHTKPVDEMDHEKIRSERVILEPPVKYLSEDIFPVKLRNAPTRNTQSIDNILHVPPQKEPFFGVIPITGNRGVFINIDLKIYRNYCMFSGVKEYTC